MNRWNPSQLTCREVVAVVDDYLSDVLSTPDRASFEQHLHACPWCLTYLDQMRQTILLTRKLKEAGLPTDVEAELRAAFRAHRTGLETSPQEASR